MEERRLLNAFLLTFLVLMAYYTIFPPPATKPPVVPARSTPTPATGPGSTAPAVESSAPPAPPSAVAVRVSAEREYRIDVETPDIEVGFKNRGARLISWKINKFRDPQGDPEEMVDTTPSGPLPFDLETGDADVDRRLREALFQSSTDSLKLKASEEGRVVFEYADGDLEARKEIVFQGTGYLVSVKASVRREGRELSKKIVWGPGVGHPSADEKASQGYTDPHGAALVSSGVERKELDKIDSAGITYNDIRWVGIESRHFVALWVPPGDRGAGELRRVDLVVDGAKPRPAAAAHLALGASAENALLYVGPKDYDGLKRLGHELVRVVPVDGWLGPIVVFMMNTLRWIHSHVGNYGWAIIALTVLISLFMAPLRHYGIVTGRKMAKIAPEMKVIQERYRKLSLQDPKRQEMHHEMSALYSKHGMNMGTQMAVGCLPILITMPFLWAVYQVLNVSIDLRGADFAWVPDLSHRDPFFLMPILMAVSMFLMQRLTPSTMDPAQQRIMMLMPIMLLVFCAAAPAGLNLYWFVSNVCSIIQQVVTLRFLASQERSVPVTMGKGQRRR